MFIVGNDPATTMDSDFWGFWRSGYGFDKAAWFEAYKRERGAQPLKPGRTRRRPVSVTRHSIDLVVAAAAPVRCLETNVYGAASDSAADLVASDRHTAVLEPLLKTVKPRLIVAHGREASAQVPVLAPKVATVTANHFSYQTSDAGIRELGLEVRRRLAAG